MRALRELWEFRVLVLNLASRELRAKYKKSVLGWLWSLINPLAILLVYTLVFGVFLRIEPPVAGNGELESFGLYLFAALVLWNLFHAIVNGSMASLAGAGPLLRKVYFPPECTVIANVLAALLQAVAEAVILAAVLVVVSNVSWTFLLFPVLMALLVVFATGIGLIVSIGNIYYRDVSYLVGIALNILFYATPIIYPLSFVPGVAWGLPAKTIIELNPLTQFTELARNLMYGLESGPTARWGYVLLASIVSLALGWYVFQRRAALVSEEV